MSSTVLARKYRPKRFDEMVGQDHVVQALSNALTRRRLHHAYLFTGTRGVGKTTVSRILAKCLNCTGPDGSGDITATPCGVCPACTDIDAGRHVDYVELDAASNRGVEEITQLLDQAVYKPVVGRYKVYLIDEVHMLSTTAFNAMLKTLEEPPDYLKFVLATTDPQKVPVTVLSRCLQFNLRPMAAPTVQEHLARVLADEGIESDAASLRLLARAAMGSMRDALSLSDQAIAFGAGRLEERSVRQMLGAVDRGHALRIVEALAIGDGAALLSQTDDLRGLGLSAAGLLEELALLAQQMAVVQAVPEAADADDPDTPEVLRLAALLPREETQLLYSIALQGRAELPLAPDEHAGLVMVLLRVLAFTQGGAPGGARAEAPRPARAASAAAPRAQPERAVATYKPPLAVTRAVPPARAAGPIEPVPTVPRVDAPARPPTDFQAGLATELGDRWQALVGQLTEAGLVVALPRELAVQAECCRLELDAAVPRIGLRVERESVRSEANRDKLRGALAALLQRESVELEVEAGVPRDSIALREAAERERRQREAERIILDDPLVQDMLRQYSTARIVPGSIKPH